MMQRISRLVARLTAMLGEQKPRSNSQRIQINAILAACLLEALLEGVPKPTNNVIQGQKTASKQNNPSRSRREFRETNRCQVVCGHL
jgi:hypothetical protein